MLQQPNPMAMFGLQRVPTMQKFDFPMEIQVYFKNKNIGHVRTDPPKKCRKYDSIFFNRPDILQKFEFGPPPPRDKPETKAEQKRRIKREKRREHKKMVKKLFQEWDPFNDEDKDENYTKDPYKTLFIGHLSKAVTEQKLRKEFEHFGEIKTLRIIKDKNGKSKGYAFIEYEHTKDFLKAYKKSDGKRIEDKRVLVDFEKARTMLNFKPYRFGGTFQADTSKSKDRKKKKKKDKEDEKSKSKSRSRSRSRDKDKKKKDKKAKKEKLSEKDQNMNSPDRANETIQDEEREKDNLGIEDKDKKEKKEKKEKKDKKKKEKEPEESEKKTKKNKDKEKERDNKEKDHKRKRSDEDFAPNIEDGELHEEKRKKHKKEKEKKK